MTSTEETPDVEPTYGDGNYTVPSTEVAVREEVAELRAEIELLRQAAAPARRTVPTRLDEWVLVVRDYNLLAQSLAKTAFVPRNFQGKPDQITAVMMYGREIGLPPMTTLQNTYEVFGRVGMYAEQLRAMILDAGHEFTIDEMTSDRCTLSGRRKGSERWETFTYTVDQAKRAGIYSRKDSQWPVRPLEMCFARASSAMAHGMFPDVIRGMSSVEELEDVGADAVEAPAAGGEPARKSTTTVGRKRAAKAAIDPGPVASPEVEKPETVVPDKAGIPPLAGEAEAPVAVSDEPRRMNVDEALASAAGPVVDDGTWELIPPAAKPDEETKSREEYVDQSGAVATRPKPMHTAQTKALQARFKGLGFTDEPDDREQRLMIAEAIVGHPVDTFRAGTMGEGMTYDEADQVMKVLAPCRSREDVIELMVRISQDAAAEEAQG